MATCDIPSRLASAKCYACLSPHERDIIELQLLCELVSRVPITASGPPAAFTLSESDFILGNVYTNGPRMAWVSAGFENTTLGDGNEYLWIDLQIDNDNDGIYEMNGITQLWQYIDGPFTMSPLPTSNITRVRIDGWVNPNCKFMFVDNSIPAGAIVAGSCQWLTI